MWEVLSDAEQAKAKRFKFTRHRRRSVVARGSLRHLIGRYLQQDPADIQFHTAAHGKPYIKHLYQTRELCFNVSHSHECALIAFTLDRRVGVDVEHMRSVKSVDGIARQFFAPSEAARLQTVSEADKHAAFLRCWTRKEAYIKAIGEGLSHPLRDFEVTFLKNEKPRLIGADDWQLFNLEVGEQYVAAVIAEGDQPLTFDRFQL